MSTKRDSGFIVVFAVAAGAMISSGLFHLPHLLPWEDRPGMFLCYLGAAVLLLPSLLSIAELVTAMPKAGGAFFFIDRGLGPGFGTIGGVAVWASLALKSAFAAVGLAVLLTPLVGEGAEALVACACCVLFGAMSLLVGERFQRLRVSIVLLLLLVLVGYVVWGGSRVDVSHYRGIANGGSRNMIVGMALVFVAFGGVTKAASLGERVRKPKRDIILGMFLATLVVGLLYGAVVFVTTGLLPIGDVEWEVLPLSQAGEILGGAGGRMLLSGTAVVAFLAMGSAGISSAAHIVSAMAKDGLLPAPMAATHDARPVHGVLVTSVFIIAAILALNIELFVAAASAMTILVFLFSMAALAFMRESRMPSYNPTWRCPLYPWLQILGGLAYVFMLVELGTPALAVSGVILGAALLWYVFFTRVHVARESALVHVAARLAGAHFREHDLEAELSRVVRERDQHQTDRFDRLIADCVIIDHKGAASRQDLFRNVAVELARSLPLTADDVVDLLERRESISTTVMRPGMAIPHVIVEGLETFEIVLVRSREGVEFEPGQPLVHSVFVMAASPVERNFYLKALMAVAEIAQEPEFDHKWLRAVGVDALREVVLAAERRRELEHGESSPG